MAKVKLTAGRIADFNCPEGKAQAFLWCADVQGLAIRATPGSTRKRYIFESKINAQTVRMTIGEVGVWSISDAQAEARRLQTLIDQGKDPRQVKADIAAANVAALLAKEADAAALKERQTRETITVADAWQTYVTNRSESILNGKPEWGEKHKAHHAYFIQAGGVKRTRGRRPNEPETTRPGILVPLMTMRLADLDAKAISAWLEKEVAQAPTTAAQAFRALRAFLTWCAKQDAYSAIVHADACQSDNVKQKVPSPQTKKNDCLRRAQIKPWFDGVIKIGNPVISAYLQTLLLTGARRNELASLRWRDVDFRWKSLTIRDKIEGERTIPLTPYVEHLISALPHRNLTVRQLEGDVKKAKKGVPNVFVFSSTTSKSGRLEEPRNQHNKALTISALPALSLHGLRRSFGTLSEWVEVPVGIVAQIMGHKPSAIAEKHYIQRELDLLHLWHVKIEAWILKQADITFVPARKGLRVVK
jgi:integrase